MNKNGSNKVSFPIGLIANNSCLIAALNLYFLNFVNKERFTTTNGSIFYQEDSPSIKFYDYLIRIDSYLTIEPICFIATMIYAERQNMIHICENSVHRYFITAINTSIKSLSDIFYTNNYMAKVGGITVKELTKMEILLCNHLEWKLQVFNDELNQMWEKIVKLLKK